MFGDDEVKIWERKAAGSLRRGMKMKKYQYLLFDLDGTLTDSKPGITACVQYSLEKMGWKVPPAEELLSFIGPPLLESYQKIIGMTFEEAEQATAIYRERYSKTGLFENDVYPGIPEALEGLQASGYVLAIATSKPEEYLVRILAHFHLERYFTVLSGSSLSGERNSKTEVVKDALEQLAVWKDGSKYGTFYRNQEVNPERLAEIKQAAIMIGDRHHDIEGARACGIDSLGIHYGYAEPGELKRAGAVYEKETVEDMYRFFLEME